jgi:hypothetical protein
MKQAFFLLIAASALAACTPDDLIDEEALCDFCPDLHCADGSLVTGDCDADGICLKEADVCPMTGDGGGGGAPGSGGSAPSGPGSGGMAAGGAPGSGGEGGAGGEEPSCKPCSEWNGTDTVGLCEDAKAMVDAISQCICVTDCSSACAGTCGVGTDSGCDGCIFSECEAQLTACANDT